MLGLFESRSLKEKKTAVANVVAVMTADGSVDADELTFLMGVCERVGLDKKELKVILASPAKVKFTVPKNEKDRVWQLIDMVLMMVVDGKLDQREMNVCASLAVRLGFPAKAVPKMIGALVAANEKKVSLDRIAVDMGEFLQA